MSINKIMMPIYFEPLAHNSMISYTFFIDKLREIENHVKKFYLPNIKKTHPSSIKNSPSGSQEYYRLGNIFWPTDTIDVMNHQKSYPSQYFIDIILNTTIISGNITNPPIQLTHNLIPHFKYINLDHNKLLILDALMKQGSQPNYENNNKYIYSEHSGAITLRNNIVDNVIVFASSNRTDYNDDNIFLPKNNPMMERYEFLFHTHPNTQILGGRINEGIIYEFPSANDILNFVKYHDSGILQASIVVSAEGTYVIRQIYYQKNYNLDTKFYYFLRKYILKLENKALKKFADIQAKISDPDIFYKFVSQNFKYIGLYNKYLEPYNIFIEYYPRIKKNDTWMLAPINLQLVSLN